MNTACLVFVILWSQVPEHPEALDHRLVVELFAREPQIVHPIALTFDHEGRLLVIESHTHFRPEDYEGPPADRIRVIEDTDGDGRADRFRTFFEGTRHTMDLAAHPDGSIYVATRREIFRLRDLDGDGAADERRRIVLLKTPGTYPHNGLSGLCFDTAGNLIFGMGENLGEPYELIGADGTVLRGGGEGGGIYRCTAEGEKLERIATGFWNPFGITFDPYGRLFAVDNDPDSSPPCRLLYIVKGGDYGYQYRYGRSGRHPLQSWNGRLPGTLPMVAGTGEGPCEVLLYDSDGLPPEYRGQLFVTAWADHVVQRFVVEPLGAGYRARAEALVRGPEEFRPVGLAVAPDGSLFISDWVLSNYELHGRGAIWHVRWRAGRERSTRRPSVVALDRRLREEALRRGADPGPALRHPDSLVRATALRFAARRGVPETVLRRAARSDPALPVRALAVRLLAERGADVRLWLQPGVPPLLQREALRALQSPDQIDRLAQFLVSSDPFLAQAARMQCVRHPGLLRRFRPETAAQRAALLLIYRLLDPTDRRQRVLQFLADADRTVRFLAVKWVADGALKHARSQVQALARAPQSDVALFVACSTALARIDGRAADERTLARELVRRALDRRLPVAQRVLALRSVPAEAQALRFDVLERLFSEASGPLRGAALRTLWLHGDARRFALFRQVAEESGEEVGLRADAVVGLAFAAERFVGLLLRLARRAPEPVRTEAVRALVGVTLSEAERKQLATLRGTPAFEALVARVLGSWRPPPDRPPREALKRWIRYLDGPFDPARGRRVFFHPRLARCYRCHRVNGRGAVVGPDLSVIGTAGRRHIVESLLRPSATVAPGFQSWLLRLSSGQLRTGLLVRTHLDESTYVGPDGEVFRVKAAQIEARRPVPGSIMPENLVDGLTDQEMRDLVGWLSGLGAEEP